MNTTSRQIFHRFFLAARYGSSFQLQLDVEPELCTSALQVLNVIPTTYTWAVVSCWHYVNPASLLSHRGWRIPEDFYDQRVVLPELKILVYRASSLGKIMAARSIIVGELLLDRTRKCLMHFTTPIPLAAGSYPNEWKSCLRKRRPAWR